MRVLIEQSTASGEDSSARGDFLRITLVHGDEAIRRELAERLLQRRFAVSEACPDALLDALGEGVVTGDDPPFDVLLVRVQTPSPALLQQVRAILGVAWRHTVFAVLALGELALPSSAEAASNLEAQVLDHVMRTFLFRTKIGRAAAARGAA